MEQYSAQPAPAPERQSGRGRSIGAAFLYFGIYLALQSAVVFVYAIVTAVLSIVRTGSLDASALVAQLLASSALLSGISNLLTLVVYWIIFAARRCRFAEETFLRPASLPALLIMIPLGFCSHIFVSGVLSLLPEPLLASYSSSANALLNSSGPLFVLCIAFIAPVAEEILFRGLMYTRFRRGMGRWLALFVTSLIFGFMHGNLVWGAYAFALSLLLCSVLEWYGSLWACLLLHISFNASEYAVAAFPEDLPVLPLLIGAALLCVPLILLAYRVGKKTRRSLLQ